MIGEAVLLSDWDDWDDWDNGDKDSGRGQGPNDPPDGRRGGGDHQGTSMPLDPEKETWGTRGGGGRGIPPAPRGDSDPDVYTIRAVNEVPYRGMSAIEKIFSGKPLFANNQYNLQLQRSGSVGHGGGAVNGVIYGKIENQAICNGMKVRIKGRHKRGLMVIERMYDVDSGDLEIYINHYWRDPYATYQGRGNPGLAIGILLIVFLIAAAFALLLSAFQAFGGGLDPAFVAKVKIIAAIAAILVFIKVFNINIFNNPVVQILLFLVIAVAAAIYIPGGDYVISVAASIYVLYLIFKSIFK